MQFLFEEHINEPHIRILATSEWARLAKLVATTIRKSKTPPRDDVTLIFCDDYFRDNANEQLSSKESCIPITMKAGSIYVGPLLSNESGSSFLDVQVRHNAALKNSAVDWELRDLKYKGPIEHRIGKYELTWIAANIVALLESFSSDLATFAGREHELALDPIKVISHPVIPLPGQLPDHYAGRHSWDDLIDLHSGIITHVTTRPLGGGFVLGTEAVARMADMSVSVPNWVKDRQGFGMGLTSGGDLVRTAVSEILEAYAGAYWQQLPVKKRIESPNTKSNSDPSWEVEGVDLLTMKPSTIPARLVFLNWQHVTETDKKTLTNITGIAAGPSIDFATISALEEVVERDAMTVWWLNAPLLNRRLPDAEFLRSLGILEKGPIRLSFIDLPNPFRIPVVAAVLEHDELPTPVLGFAARHTSEAAQMKASLEAFMLLDTIRGLDNPASELWEAIHSSTVERGALVDWREDRAYRSSFPRGVSEVTDLLTQLQCNLDPAVATTNAPMLSGPVTTQNVTNEDLVTRSIKEYLNRFSAAGISPKQVVLTTSDLRICGVEVVRVVAEELVGNAPVAWAPIDHPRVIAGGVAEGWRDPKDPFVPNLSPMPYA